MNADSRRWAKTPFPHRSSPAFICGSLLLLLACVMARAAAQDAQPKSGGVADDAKPQVIVVKNGDKEAHVTVVVEKDALRIKIVSPGGIGRCKLSLTKGKWPKHAVVELLHAEDKPFWRLEHFVAGLVDGDGKTTTPLKETKRRTPEQVRPEFDIPEDASTRSLALDWIDAYRR